MSNYSIPVVDLNDFKGSDSAKQAKFVKTVGEALTDLGFFALTGHGISDDEISASYAALKDFSDLPEETKRKYSGVNGGQRGFTAFGVEHAKDNKDAPDLKEFWHVGREITPDHPMAKHYPQNVWPEELPSFKKITQSVYNKLDQCGLLLLEACALHLDEARDRFSSLAREGNSIYRLINYPPIAENAHPSSIRAAAHEDINFITLLIDATSSGLEILTRENKWLPVVTPKNCIIVDSGDMLQNITNGFYKATTHRVVNPYNSRDQRFSMPFFVHPTSDASLNPLPSAVERTGGEVKFPNITAGAYLEQRLREIGLI